MMAMYRDCTDSTNNAYYFDYYYPLIIIIIIIRQVFYRKIKKSISLLIGTNSSWSMAEVAETTPSKLWKINPVARPDPSQSPPAPMSQRDQAGSPGGVCQKG